METPRLQQNQSALLAFPEMIYKMYDNVLVGVPVMLVPSCMLSTEEGPAPPSPLLVVLDGTVARSPEKHYEKTH